MKTKFSLLTVLLVIVLLPIHAQSKKEIEDNLAKCQQINDSLQTTLTSLSASFDSISAGYMVYDTMYNVIKEKVFKIDFNPADISVMIDSLRTGREEVFSDSTAVLNDSISVLLEENVKLKETIESMKGDVDKDDTVGDLKKLKELLDEEIITQEEFDAKKAVLLEKL